jgi:hypothetical protein
MFGYDKDELWNAVIKTYQASASSGSTMAAFLKQPYTRDWPECKFCEPIATPPGPPAASAKR